jgi:hypothetical protein
MVDVTGIDRKELLQALWENAKPAGFFTMASVPSHIFDIQSAMKAIRFETFVDYACGRSIKAEIFTEENRIDPNWYDLDYGKGAFQKVVDTLRK